MVKKSVQFNAEEEIQKAFEFTWAQKLKDRKDGHDYNGQTYYVTATDLERRVRGAVAEKAEGKKYGHYGLNYSGWQMGIRIHTGSRLNLFELCRSYLLGEARNGTLDAHNFKRGHISGERFRPHGQPLSEAEQKTFEKKEKVQLVHIKDPEVARWPAKPLCSRALRQALEAKKTNYSRPNHRQTAKFTSEWTGPATCPRCLKLQAELEKSLAEDGIVKVAE